MESGQQYSISSYPSLEKYYCLNIAAAGPPSVPANKNSNDLMNF